MFDGLGVLLVIHNLLCYFMLFAVYLKFDNLLFNRKLILSVMLFKRPPCVKNYPSTGFVFNQDRISDRSMRLNKKEAKEVEQQQQL